MIVKINRLLLFIVTAIYFTATTDAQQYHWQNTYVKVIATGDLQWQPEPFVYPARKGEEVRYIDYENGNDENDGLTKDTPWKHHPWDSRATGEAAGESGVISYVFKRGVMYRNIS